MRRVWRDEGSRERRFLAGTQRGGRERERCGDGKANPKKSKRVGKERAKVQTPRNTLSFRALRATIWERAKGRPRS